MDKQKPHVRLISLGPSDLTVTAMVAEKNNPGVFRMIVFGVNAIDHLREVNEGVSAIVLGSGVAVPVAHPLQKLHKMIYRPDFRQGDALDLTNVSGGAVKGVSVQEPENGGGDNAEQSLLISAVVRMPESNVTRMFDFHESDIKSYGPDSTTRSKSGSSVKIVFNHASKRPFENSVHDYVMIDMPYDDFMKELIGAKTSNKGKLDLCAMFVAHPKKYGLDAQ